MQVRILVYMPNLYNHDFHNMIPESNWLYFILMRTVIGLKLLQSKVKSGMMWFSRSTRKEATLSARLQWTPHIVSSNYLYGMGTFVIVSINLCRLCGCTFTEGNRLV